MTGSGLEWVAAGIFGIAVVHTFTAKMFERVARRYPRHAGLFHLLGEVEVVFGLRAIVLVVSMAVLAGPSRALDYAALALEGLGMVAGGEGRCSHQGREGASSLERCSLTTCDGTVARLATS